MLHFILMTTNLAVDKINNFPLTHSVMFYE